MCDTHNTGNTSCGRWYGHRGLRTLRTLRGHRDAERVEGVEDAEGAADGSDVDTAASWSFVSSFAVFVTPFWSFHIGPSNCPSLVVLVVTVS